MTKNWGVAQFNSMGSMEYLLESGAWLPDRQLFDGAPIVLFETMSDADARAKQLPQSGQPSGVQFLIDQYGKVLTASSAAPNKARTARRTDPAKKAQFTVFEDKAGYWFVPYAMEDAARAAPDQHRGEIHPTKIAACRAALAQAIANGANELHLHGFGATTGIKKEAMAKGVKPLVYWPSITTKLAPYHRSKA